MDDAFHPLLLLRRVRDSTRIQLLVLGCQVAAHGYAAVPNATQFTVPTFVANVPTWS